MQTFNYKRAWVEAARPAYEQHILPNSVISALYDRVLHTYRERHQDQTLGIPWASPEDRQAFLQANPTDLAFASRVIHAMGHWFPGDYGLGPLFRETLVMPGREWGAYWKFSALADQALRIHLGLHEFADPRFHGWAFRVYEGQLRLCYSSQHMWAFKDICPADPQHSEQAEALKRKAYRAIESINQAYTHKRDDAAYSFITKLRAEGSGLWPERWLPFVNGRFMEPEDQERRYIPNVVALDTQA